VIYKNSNKKALWSSRTAKTDADRVCLLIDGNFVIYKGNLEIWSSRTTGNPNAVLTMQDNGNLVVRNKNAQVVWASKTFSNCSADEEPQNYLNGKCLRRNDFILSANGCFRAILQLDSNFVVQRVSDKKVLWNARTGNSDADRVCMQAGGNLAILKEKENIWSSRTWKNPNAGLVMQDDGNLVIFSVDGRILWSTNTQNYCQ
jgi:hypothetical protein